MKITAQEEYGLRCLLRLARAVGARYPLGIREIAEAEVLVAHNAPFDFGFLDAEFERIGKPALSAARMIDTLALAKARFPGMPNSLDALCRRFAIDLSARSTHNALLDCRLLADVYVELTGGRQRGLALVTERAAVDVVFPTPPLPDVTTTTFAMASTPGLCDFQSRGVMCMTSPSSQACMS